ncbi:MAG: RNA polymerase sigma factor [Bacteriovoracaceae bacterium]|jgi:RNA polymerase sigma factor (sigma-70 family)|nr:RNA polymerase sigma factor [Bacteriovoracaceae bacterium]
MSIKTKTKLLALKLVGIGNVSDFELMQLITNGNRGAFEMMYNTYKRPIYNFLLNLMKGDEKTAEDLLQDTFLKAFHRANQFKEDGKLTAWLWAIARNNAFDTFKKKDALNFITTLTNEDGEVIGPENLSIEMTDAEKILIKKLERDEVHHCIDKLKDKPKEVVMLQMFSDLSYEEISESVEASVSSIKSLLNRARKSLFACLKGIKEKQENEKGGSK